jgi:hypothetical protein
MTRTNHQRTTKVEKLHSVLSDGQWHSTAELARRVGHTFGVAKFKLVGYGHQIDRRRHPRARHQHEYRMTVER